MNQRLYTIKLGQRKWVTTSFVEALKFSYAFKGEKEDTKAEPFKSNSKPYSGAEIPTVINVQ